MTTDEHDGIPDPPWQRARARAVARTPLTRDGIVDAALRLVSREGLGAVSMRRVASELGTGAASLYWHVNSKDELFDLMFDRLIGEQGGIPAPDPETWQEQVKELMRGTRRALQRHRDVARVAIDRVPLGPNALRFTEGLLAILQAGGLPDGACVYATELLPSYVGWVVVEESTGLASPRTGGVSLEKMLGMMRDYLASLPTDRFPHLVRLADLMMANPPDERFEFGLDVLVRGLAAQVVPLEP